VGGIHEVPFLLETLNLNGCYITTRAGTAVVTYQIFLDSNYVLLDASNTSGILSLNDTLDTLRFYNRDGVLLDMAIWGGNEWGMGFPTPPQGFSASRYNGAGGECNMSQYITWYFDSLPTPGFENHPPGKVMGLVKAPDGEMLSHASITAEGPRETRHAHSGDYLCPGLFWLNALSPGNYHLRVIRRNTFF